MGGAYLAALLIAQLQAFMLLVPDFEIAGLTISIAKMTLIPSFLVMAVVLIARPYGLLGKAPSHPRNAASVAAYTSNAITMPVRNARRSTGLSQRRCMK